MSVDKNVASLQAWAIKMDDYPVNVSSIRLTEEDCIEDSYKATFCGPPTNGDSKRQCLEDCGFTIVRVRIEEVKEGE